MSSEGALLSDRVAIVTGAGRGIGAGVARLLATQGASVVVNDLGVDVDGSGGSRRPADEVVADIIEGGGAASSNFADITDHDAAKALVDQAIGEFGKLDVVVNAAGILRDRMIFNMSAEEWDAVIRVHLRGAFNTTKHASAYWRELRDESANHRLINVTSSSGLFGAAGQPNYAAAKMGVVGLTYSCANALGKYGVTSNAIAPVAFTRMASAIPDDRLEPSMTETEGVPENVAPMVAYLASVRSSWLNGEILGAGGFKVSLYNKPAVLSELVSDGPWDVHDLAGRLEEEFADHVVHP